MQLLSVVAAVLICAWVVDGMALASGAQRNIVLGLNPALQRSIKLGADLEAGAVNRGTSAAIGIGGKGQDVFIASHSQRCADLPLLAQFLGAGPEGDALLALLSGVAASVDDAERAALDLLTVRSSARLRNAITLLSPVSGEATEIVEPSGSVSPDEIEQLKAKLRATPAAPGVAVMGSMPPGCPAALYSELLPLCTDRRSAVLLDIVGPTVVPTIAGLSSAASGAASGAAAGAAAGAGAERRVDTVVLKVNIKELCAVAGMAGAAGGSDSSASRSGLLLAAAGALAEQIHAASGAGAAAGGAAAAAGAAAGGAAGGAAGVGAGETQVLVAATDGAFFAHLLLLGGGRVLQHVKYTLPALPRPLLNPIGAGDAVASGMLAALTGKAGPLPVTGGAGAGAGPVLGRLTLAGGADPVAAFRWGLACGAASCMTDANSVFARADAEALFAGIGLQAAPTSE